MAEKIIGKIKLRIGFILLLSSSLVWAVLSSVDSSKNLTFPQCRLNMKSTCGNKEIAKWNTKNIARHLKDWIKSISVEWKVQETITGGRHCKVFIVKKNSIFEDYAPYFFSPNIVMLGKVMHQNKNSKYTKYENIDKLKRPKFYGPIWADISNEQQWNIRQDAKGGSAGVVSDALLAHGLYYGVLNNDQMRLGNFHSNKYYSMTLIIPLKGFSILFSTVIEGTIFFTFSRREFDVHISRYEDSLDRKI